MSILVKDVDMPERCAKCFLKSICDKRIYMERRPEYCPLIELQPHGRLIDADAMAEFWKGRIIEGSIEPLLDACPTIIPAEPCNDLAKPNNDADCPPSIPLEQVWTELFGEECE